MRFWSKEIEKNLSDCVQEIEDEIKNLKMNLKGKISIKGIGNKQLKKNLIEDDGEDVYKRQG